MRPKDEIKKDIYSKVSHIAVQSHEEYYNDDHGQPDTCKGRSEPYAEMEFVNKDNYVVGGVEPAQLQPTGKVLYNLYCTAHDELDELLEELAAWRGNDKQN